jgi:hypothetical protein
VDVAIGHRANFAQPLSKYEIGPQSPDLVSVERNDRTTGLPQAAHLGIDGDA